MRALSKYFFVFLGLLAIGCAGNREQTNETRPFTKDSIYGKQFDLRAAGADTVIQIYSGGGFSGVYSGCKVSTKGTVIHFTRNARGNIVKENQVVIPVDSVHYLLKELFATGIFQHAVHKTGNMTYYFTYQDGNQSFSISWVSEHDVPAAFWRWYINYRQRCQRWTNNNHKVQN